MRARRFLHCALRAAARERRSLHPSWRSPLRSARYASGGGTEGKDRVPDRRTRAAVRLPTHGHRSCDAGHGRCHPFPTSGSGRAAVRKRKRHSRTRRTPSRSATFWPALVWERSYRSDSRFRVRLFDHRVPRRNELLKIAPEGLAGARFELPKRCSLLLDPGEIAEIEDPLAIAACELEEMVGRRAEDVLAIDAGGVNRVESAVEACRERLLDFAHVHLR